MRFALRSIGSHFLAAALVLGVAIPASAGAPKSPYDKYRNATYSNDGLMSEQEEMRLGAQVHQQVLQQIMVANLKDEAQSWTLDADGRYTRDPSWDHPGAFSAHEYFMTNPSLSGRGEKVKDMPRAIDHVAPRG